MYIFNWKFSTQNNWKLFWLFFFIYRPFLNYLFCFFPTLFCCFSFTSFSFTGEIFQFSTLAMDIIVFIYEPYPAILAIFTIHRFKTMPHKLPVHQHRLYQGAFSSPLFQSNSIKNQLNFLLCIHILYCADDIKGFMKFY